MRVAAGLAAVTTAAVVKEVMLVATAQVVEEENGVEDPTLKMTAEMGAVAMG